ncbi:12441_t:CDS:10, partial [Gigaspora margarita]
RKLNNYNDLIDFESQEYDNRYASPTYQKDTIDRWTNGYLDAFTGRKMELIDVFRYEISLDEGEEDDNRKVIIDSNDATILPLYNIVTDNRYGNTDYQDEYEERTYAYEYRRPQINNPIIDSLEPETQPKNNCFLQTPQVRFDNPSPPLQRHPPTPQPRPQPLPAHRAVVANPMDQLIQSMNNFILAIENNASQFQEAKVVKFLTFSSAKPQTQQQGLEETVDEYYDELERLYHKADPTKRYPQVDHICQFVDGLRQELKEPVEIESLKKTKTAKAAYFKGGPLSSYSLKRSYLSQKNPNNKELNELKKAISEMAQNIKTFIQKQNENKKLGENAKSKKIIDPLNNRLNQLLPNKLLPPLVLNSSMEMLDVSKLPIEVTYSLTRNLIDIHRQRKHLLGVVKNFLIKINKMEIPIDVEVMEAREYMLIVGTDRLAKVKGKIDLEHRSTKLRYYCVKLIEEERNDCLECKEVISEMETLECLVDNLEEELGIPAAVDGINELEIEQRTQVEDLIKANEKIFAEGLIQLEQTKEEMHKIVLKEEAKPIKQRPYQ